MTAGSSTGGAWPFLVARGRERGYATLLAPDFLVEARSTGWLSQSVDSGDTTYRSSRRALVESSPVGPMTIVYIGRVASEHDAAPHDPAADPGARLLDRHGRPISVMYGFVRRSRAPADDLRPETVEGQAMEVFARFLRDEEGFDVVRSTSVPTTVPDEWVAPEVREMPVRRAVARPWLPVVAAWLPAVSVLLVVLAVAAALLIFVLGWHLW